MTAGVKGTERGEREGRGSTGECEKGEKKDKYWGKGEREEAEG